MVFYNVSSVRQIAATSIVTGLLLNIIAMSTNQTTVELAGNAFLAYGILLLPFSAMIPAYKQRNILRLAALTFTEVGLIVLLTKILIYTIR
jgi:predicted transporter